ncbi:MAG TPA: MarR family winged helix-turn-helix transcriptional regulator [Nitrospiria bacterium]|nr:MarR family winged helix-turn-helix transcriptional regulator [Nitrospiria bacterium]
MKLMHERAGETEKPSAECCAREIMETVPRVMRFIRREMRRQGSPHLSVPQLRTLVFLNLYPGSGLSSVAEHLGVTRPTASTIVNRLVRRGLVNRTGHPRERRCIALTLTREGTRELRHVRESACAIVAGMLDGRSSMELRTVMEGVSLLGSVFKEAPHRKDS